MSLGSSIIPRSSGIISPQEAPQGIPSPSVAPSSFSAPTPPPPSGFDGAPCVPPLFPGGGAPSIQKPSLISEIRKMRKVEPLKEVEYTERRDIRMDYDILGKTTKNCSLFNS